MTAPAFPVSQLGRPTVNYSLKPDDLRVRADTVSGLANSYNGSNAALTTISVKWEWGADNYAVFQDWYRNDCKDGSIEFTIAEMYLFGSMGGLKARFTAPPKATYKAWNHYSVSATLETRTTDYITEATLDAALPTDPHTDNVTWPSDLFGYPSGDGYGEEAQSSSLRGKTEGYARPAMRRHSPITVTQVPVKWEMSQEKKILFDAWYHYKLVNGAAWFWIYTQYHGVWQYIKVRFVESISVEYEPVDWWQVSGTLETVEYNYLPLADCPTLVAPTDIVITDQPDDVSQATGTTVTLSVTATTETGTLSYQWYFGSTAVSGATSATYSFTLSGTTDGGYHVVVSNDVGHVTSRTASVTSNVILLVQVDSAGNIVERTGNGTVTTNGTVIVDHTTTQDGYGSIRNTAAGGTTAAGYTQVAASLSLTGDFTIEGWCNRLNALTKMTWLSSYPATAVWQIQNWGDTTYPQFDLLGRIVATSTIPNPAGTFLHYALVRIGSAVKLYVGGTLAASSSSSSDLSCSGILIGDGPNGENPISPCCWENIRISNVARYTANFTPPGRF